MRFHLLLAFVPMIFVCGCGGDGNSVKGTIVGKSFNAVQAVSSSTSSAGQLEAAIIAISNVDDTCARISAGTIPTNEQVLSFALFVTTGTTNTVAASQTGDYAVTNDPDGDIGIGQFATVDFESVGADTSDITMIGATAGKVTLTSAVPGHYQGSFDVTLSSSDQLSGSFDTSVCAALNL